MTIGRQFTNTFAGIDPKSVGAFIGFQALGTCIAYFLVQLLYPVNHSELRRDDNLYLRVCISEQKDSYLSSANVTSSQLDSQREHHVDKGIGVELTERA